MILITGYAARARRPKPEERFAFAFAEFRARHAPGMTARETGGAYRDRTDDLMLAKQPLSQLS